MPTYEYVCTACGEHFEKFQSITAAPIKTCPKCGKNKAQRQISGGAGFIFKGGGFYETDYRNDAYKKAAEADKAPAAVTADAKPAEGAKPDAAKPAETKAGDAPKAAEPKVEAKVEAKPASGPKPATSEAKPVKSKSKK